MRFKTFLRLSVAALPIVLAGCADSATEIRARYGNTSWTAEELTSTPYNRGSLHFTAGRFGLAVKHFEIAIAQDSDSVEALNGLAASFDRLQRFELAERYYLRALNLEPDNVQTLNNLGFSYLMQGRHDLALAYLKDAVAKDPMNEMVRDNLQYAEASLELETRNFLASAVGSDEFLDVGAEPRSVSLHTESQDGGATSLDPVSQEVQIRALAAPENIWIERSSAVVQSLVTQPSPDLLLSMRDAGLAPRIGNYRNQTAVTNLQTQAAPWETTQVMIAEATFARELSGAIRQDQLVDDLKEWPLAAGSVAVDIARLPQLSATVIEDPETASLFDMPQLSAAIMGSGADDQGSAAGQGPDPSAAGSLADLRQLSAALLEAEDSPPEGELPATEVEAPAVRQEAGITYETVPYRHHESRNQDLPDLPPGSDESPVIEVSNGTGRPQMAFRMSQFLESEGLSAKSLTNAEHFRHQETVIFYHREWLQKARELAAHLPVEVRLEAAPHQRPDIRIRLGGDLLNFDQDLFYANRESPIEPTG